jgi:hypothetical protein
MRTRAKLAARGISERCRRASLRRLASHLPEGSRITEDGSILISPGLGVRDFHDRLEQTYRFWRLRRRWNRLIRPVRLCNLRGHYRTARSLLKRARHGVGPHDTWALGQHRYMIAARGLRMLAATPAARSQCTDAGDVLDRLCEDADALEQWCRHTRA